jgi:hypothetical protein
MTQEAFRLVLDSDGLEQTQKLAATYSRQAVDCLQGMAAGEARWVVCGAHSAPRPAL